MLFDRGRLPGQGCVYLIDDDRDIRAQLGALLSLLGYDVRTFADPVAFLEAIKPDDPSVVILDMTMPQMSGLEVQQNLEMMADSAAVVLFLSGNSDREQIVRAMKAGAEDFLWKPVSRQELSDTVAAAMERSVDRTEHLRRLRVLRGGLSQLSARERQIYELMINGHQNKQIATQLNIRADTVKKHRTVICEKFLVSGTPDLIELARTVGDHFVPTRETSAELSSNY